MKISGTIYLDHQATTPVDERVLDEMLPHFRESFGNPHSADHTLGWKSALAVEQAAVRIAELIGADSDEIIFTSGATEANNMALLGLKRNVRSESGRRRFILSDIEHKCVLAAGRVISSRPGFSADGLPVDKHGCVLLESLEGALDNDVLAVSIMAVNNEIGTIQDIGKISDIIRKAGAVFHCDAAQAPIAMDLRGIAERVDLLSLSAHKMYGPKGIGALYIRRELQAHLEPLIHGGGQQNGLRAGTIPTALCVGMGAAAEFLNSDEAVEKRALLRQRRDRFVRKMASLPWSIGVNGAGAAARHPGNANMCFAGFTAQDILQALQPHLAASTGSACTSGIPEPSHVLKAIGLSPETAEASVRFSLGFDTTDTDVDDAVALIDNVLGELSTNGLFNDKLCRAA
ncbi:MAG: cysteine desulfurase family protein [Gammaproteobacteria bacterium]|nr:cysteine desulfurase family protein [Gammaproteobacteria bacterium]